METLHCAFVTHVCNLNNSRVVCQDKGLCDTACQIDWLCCVFFVADYSVCRPTEDAGLQQGPGGALCDIHDSPSRLLQADADNCAPLLGCRPPRAPSLNEGLQEHGPPNCCSARGQHPVQGGASISPTPAASAFVSCMLGISFVISSDSCSLSEGIVK